MSDDPDPALTDATGGNAPSSKLVVSRVGPYLVMVRVASATNEFIEVVQVSVDRDFRSRRQVLGGRGFHDVADLYEAKEP